MKLSENLMTGIRDTGKKRRVVENFCEHQDSEKF